MLKANGYNMSALFSAYNYAKNWARRTGITTEGRVDSALSYLMSGMAQQKWMEYATSGSDRRWTCRCPDHEIRNIYCKHILARMIEVKYRELMIESGLDPEPDQPMETDPHIEDREFATLDHYKMWTSY